MGGMGVVSSLLHVINYVSYCLRCRLLLSGDGIAQQRPFAVSEPFSTTAPSAAALRRNLSLHRNDELERARRHPSWSSS